MGDALWDGRNTPQAHQGGNGEIILSGKIHTDCELLRCGQLADPKIFPPFTPRRSPPPDILMQAITDEAQQIAYCSSNHRVA